MGRYRNKKRTNPFVMVAKDMLQSEAWLSLTNAARVAWLHLEADYNGAPDKENHLRLTYSQAERLMARRTFARAIRELQEKGFITKTRHGGLYNNCSEYGRNHDWRKWKREGQK